MNEICRRYGMWISFMILICYLSLVFILPEFILFMNTCIGAFMVGTWLHKFGKYLKTF